MTNEYEEAPAAPDWVIAATRRREGLRASAAGGAGAAPELQLVGQGRVPVMLSEEEATLRRLTFARECEGELDEAGREDGAAADAGGGVDDAVQSSVEPLVSSGQVGVDVRGESEGLGEMVASAGDKGIT
jgi:hypothetical protein